MAVNKVVYGTTTLVDLTGTTATADKILTGYGAYGKDGVWMDGTASAGGSIGGFSHVKSGQVTFASRYQTTGNRAVTTIANIGFTPTMFILFATDATVDSVKTSLSSGTESNGVTIFAAWSNVGGFNTRNMMRISGTTPAASGSRNNTAWTTQTNNYLYCNGTNVYYRTASNYGLPAGGEYVWIAFA